MSYYLYKFLDNKNQVIYVGKTENIKNRMMTHFTSSGHLPKECYQSVANILYTEFNSGVDMDIYEIYYINKYKSKYNTESKYESNSTNFTFSDVKWETYSNVVDGKIAKFDNIKMGRPTVDNPKRHSIALRVTQEELDIIEDYCRKNNLTKTDLFKYALKQVVDF